MLDVDVFKTYNDAFGHPAGDEVLRRVGAILRKASRGSDMAARFGGEEFSVILPHTGTDGAAIIAERIRRAVESADLPHRKVTVSLGTATFEGKPCVESDLLAAADAALYEAKRSGRNRVVTAA